MGRWLSALNGGDDAEVEGVAGVVGEGAHAALAEDDLVVAFAHDVFSGHEELFEGSAESALEEDGLAQAAGVLEQREILHVAGADLNDIGPLSDELKGFIVDGFGNDAEAEFVSDLGHDLQRIEAHALECIRRCARLVGAAAEKLGSGGGHLFSDGKGLITIFDGAGTGDDGKVAAADGSVGAGETDDGVFFFDVAAGQFVGLGNSDDLGYSGKFFEVAAVDFTLIAGNADGGSLGSGEWVSTETQLFNVLTDRLNLLWRGLRFHDD